MKRLSSLVLCGIASCAFAYPHADFQDGNIVISGISMPVTTVQSPMMNQQQKDAPLLTPISTIKPAAALQKKTDIAPQGKTTTSSSPSTAFSQVKKSKPQPTYIVRQGERYITALEHWLTQAKIQRVAYSLPPDVTAALNAPSENGQVFNGSLREVVHQLSQTIKKPLYFTQAANGLAAVHTFKGSVDIRWVHGATLKAAIQHLTADYHWHWSEKKSWLSPDDYPLLANYPIVVPKNDFAAALNIVLDGYPLMAQQLTATKTLFIVEKE